MCRCQGEYVDGGRTSRRTEHSKMHAIRMFSHCSNFCFPPPIHPPLPLIEVQREKDGTPSLHAALTLSSASVML